jgi:hypothetical protein
MSIENPSQNDKQTEEENLGHNPEFNEKEVVEKAYTLATPRSEYVDGKLKLNFEYIFSTGEILSATEDNSGIAHIVIKKDGEEIFDFRKLVPGKFVTPSYYIKKGIPMKGKSVIEGGWGNLAGLFEIQIGDMQDPKSIALLLHEIGHIIEWRGKEGKYKYKDLTELWKIYNGPFTKKYHDVRQKLAQAISDEERTAWVEGLKIARKIKQENGINLLEGFENLRDLQYIIYVGLLSHRLGVEEDMIASDEGLMRDIWIKTKKKLGLGDKNYGAEQGEFLKDIFDKNKFKDFN